ncbi:hypothetical protein FAI41_07775 [Acetobacteraceae bacterium]|nr:hypothetical protein FAI41_07775 [Acetobacteraceae bacterium]
MKDLLDNAILSIELGVEDYQTDEDRRIISSLRNLYAGVLLLCKQVLFEKSPPKTDGSLIYKKLVPKEIDGKVLMVPQKIHVNTIDRREIEERFTTLKLPLNWKSLEKLAKIRNEIEHLFMQATPAATKEALASAMPLIEELLVTHLAKKPADLFQANIWKALLDNKAVFEQHKKHCLESFDEINWKFDILGEAIEWLSCPTCGSSLVKQIDPKNALFENINLECSECGEKLNYESIFEVALEEIAGMHAHRTKGAEILVITCPECFKEGWVMGEGCVFCGDTPPICSVCEDRFSPDDFDYCSDMCSYHAHAWEKMKAE